MRYILAYSRQKLRLTHGNKYFAMNRAVPVTFSIIPDPVNSTVKLTCPGYTQSGNSIDVEAGSYVNWEVSKQDYFPQSGRAKVTSDQTLRITLEVQFVTFTIVPTPADATVTLTADGFTQVGNSISVSPGTVITYTVNKSKYVSQSGTKTMGYVGESLNVNLEAYKVLTVNPTPSNANVSFSTNFPGAIIENNKIWVVSGSSVECVVALDGWTTGSQSIDSLTSDVEWDITLIELMTLTISPTPTDATVKLAFTGYVQEGNSITVPKGSIITYNISKTGYDTLNEQYQVNANETIDLHLVLTEKFKMTVNSGSDSSFMLPMNSQFSTDAYALNIDWGDGVNQYYSGTDNNIPHTYPAANTDYQITLSGDVGYLKKFGFRTGTSGPNVSTNKAKVKSLDSAFTTKMFASTINSSTHNLFYDMFDSCKNLTMGSAFNLPQDITSVGDRFCNSMFDGCTNIKMNSIFNLPPNLTSAGNNFCNTMFTNCTNLTMNNVFTFPQNMAGTVGTYFAAYMFEYCSNLVMGSVFNLPQKITGVGFLFCGGMFKNCSKLTMNSTFNLPPNITSVDVSFCINMFKDCRDALTMNSVFNLPQGISGTVADNFISNIFQGCTKLIFNSVFKLPQAITNVGISFCYYAFQGCTSITTGVQRFFGSLSLNQTNIDKTGVFGNTFNGCTGITEQITKENIPQLKIIPSSDNRCFNSANSTARKYTPTNWGGQGLRVYYKAFFTSATAGSTNLTLTAGKYIIMAVGAGGGGAAAGDGPRDYKACEAGGGSGSVIKGRWSLAAGTYTATIGAGGSGAGGLYTTVTGGTGGNTTFGSIITAYGGSGGVARWTDGQYGNPSGGAGGAAPAYSGIELLMTHTAGVAGGTHGQAGTAYGGSNGTGYGTGGNAYSAGYTADGYVGGVGYMKVDQATNSADYDYYVDEG